MFIAGAVIILVIAGGVMFMRNSAQKTSTPSTVTQENPAPADSQTTVEQSSPSGEETDTGEVKEFNVTNSSLKFDPTEITVNQGDKVRITFKSGGGVHDFTLDEFNVKTKSLSSSQEETVEFTADKAGTFEYYCSISNHRELGLKGNLIVE